MDTKKGARVGHARKLAVAGVLAGAMAIAGPAAAATAAGHDRDTHLPRYDYYLALGDSLASGVQPNASGQSVVTSQGYASDIAADLQERDGDLKFVNLSCPGETTATMLNGGCPFPHSYADQTDAAVAFLAAHHHARILVTVDIGANDIDGCATTGIDPVCVAKGLGTIAVDLPRILAKLKAAAGPRTEFAAMNYYDPFLAAWLTGSAGQAVATGSVALSGTFNGELAAAYSAFGIPVADVSGSFDTTDFTPVVPLTPTVSAPLNVARICQWTWMCAPAPVGPNIHANATGYREIAATFEEMIEHLR
jgi:lysophospholipase L1-like esterase